MENSCAVIEKITIAKEDEQILRKFINIMIQKLSNVVNQKTNTPNTTNKQDGSKVNIQSSLVANTATVSYSDIDEFY